jgi:hypothetical protein
MTDTTCEDHSDLRVRIEVRSSQVVWTAMLALCLATWSAVVAILIVLIRVL